MELSQQNVNVILVVWENDVPTPVALRWKYWTGYSGGRKIIIIPTKGIIIQKLKKANGTRERRSSVKSKQRQPDQKDWYHELKTGEATHRSASQKYNFYQPKVSKTNLFGARSPKSARRPYLWSTRETSDSTKAQTSQQAGTTGGPSFSSEPTKTQPSQKVGTSEGPFSRGPTKPTPGQKVGATGSPSSSSEPTKTRPGQGGATIGGPSSSSGPTKTQPGQGGGTIGGPSSSSGPSKTQPGQGGGTIGGPSSSSGPSKTQPGQGGGTIGGPSSSSGPTKTQPGQGGGTIGGPSSSSGPTKTQPGQGGRTIGGPLSSSGPVKKQPEQQVGGTVNKPTPSGSTQPKPEFSQFEKECLDEHNKFRAIHGAPPLTLSRNLCNYAQEWANHLVKIGGMQHRTEGKYGENLFMSSGMKVDARMAVKSWYDEIKFYKYGSEFSSSTGHFTQVVWKGSKELGCAFAQKGNEIYLVANYHPPGNFQGQFSANVLPPKN